MGAKLRRHGVYRRVLQAGINLSTTPVFERMKRLEKLSSFVMDEIKNTHALYL